MTMQEIKELYEIRFSEVDRAKKDAVWRVLCESFFVDMLNPQILF